MFFALPTKGTSYLADENSALIETYCCVREDPYRVIRLLSEFKNDEEFYYKIRAEVPKEEFQRTARFIYLNQTSYNGIYRVNLKGVYNVPFGFRKKVFLDEKAIVEASEKLQAAVLSCGDFKSSVDNIKSGDVVFIDPPYTVSHNKNGFIKYNKKLFSLEDYYRLRQFIKDIKDIGAIYIVTNAAHDKVREIFDFGDSVIEVNRASLIGGKKAARGQTQELIFTNTGGGSWQY